MAAIAVQHYADTSNPPPTSAAAMHQVLEAFEARATTFTPARAAAAGAPEVSEDEVSEAIRTSAKRRAPGPDGIPVELWGLCADTLVPLLAALFSAIGRTGCTPAGFTDGLVTPYHKDGDKASIANYRPITLLNTDYRLLAKCLARRWGPVLGESIGPA